MCTRKLAKTTWWCFVFLRWVTRVLAAYLSCKVCNTFSVTSNTLRLIRCLSGAKCASAFCYQAPTLQEVIRRPSSALIMQRTEKLPALTASGNSGLLVIGPVVRSRRVSTLWAGRPSAACLATPSRGEPRREGDFLSRLPGEAWTPLWLLFLRPGPEPLRQWVTPPLEVNKFLLDLMFSKWRRASPFRN